MFQSRLRLWVVCFCTREFNMEVFREKSSSISTTVYSRTQQSCESLGTLFYAKSGGNVLVAVDVRELESVTNAMPSQTSISSGSQSNTTLLASSSPLYEWTGKYTNFSHCCSNFGNCNDFYNNIGYNNISGFLEKKLQEISHCSASSSCC